MHKTRLNRLLFQFPLNFILVYTLLNFGLRCCCDSYAERYKTPIRINGWNTECIERYIIREFNPPELPINIIFIYLTIIQSKFKDQRIAWLLTFVVLLLQITFSLILPSLDDLMKKVDIKACLKYIHYKAYTCLIHIDNSLKFPATEAMMQAPAGMPKRPEYFTSYEQMVDYLAALNQYYQVFGRSRYG
uniref:Uncharacterized protein n=1 Tax=Trichobilharzia regenti TaxID=157069 RepID=A0AA85IZT5_TRIRE|nr:unnamed protein product [Trichobilharzia regenti]